MGSAMADLIFWTRSVPHSSDRAREMTGPSGRSQPRDKISFIFVRGMPDSLLVDVHQINRPFFFPQKKEKKQWFVENRAFDFFFY